MTIAPRYAAGKAVARPCPLPMELIEARAAVFDPLNCLDLGTTARRTLYGILTFLNISRPRGSIWPRRDRLRAESLLSSESSLYRGLAQLAARGYITRKQERIARNGCFHISPIQLTDKAIVLLQLEKRKAASPEVIHKSRSTKTEDGQYKEHTNEQQSLQKAFRGNRLQTSSAQQPGHLSKVPAPLRWLVELGMSPAAVFKLMGISGHVGQRLEHVAAACRDRLAQLSPREMFAYLRKAIASDRDFARVASDADARRQAQEAEQGARRFLQYARSKCDGFVVKDLAGRTLGRISTACEAILGPAGSIPMNLRWAHACVEGKLMIARSTAPA